MDDINKKLLNIVQTDFPFTERPFLSISSETGISEEECINRLKLLKKDNIIRQISAIFDTASLGYKSSLVAMRFSKDKIQHAADIINKHPGVSHNYERKHRINLWFTISVPPLSLVESHVGKLSELTNSEDTLLLPTIKLFKIGVKLDMEAGSESSAQLRGDAKYKSSKISYELNELDRTIIRELQEDIPLIAEPFKGMSDRCGISAAELLTKAEGYKRDGIMRRFAAVLRHREAGFNANMMVVWNAASGDIERCGDIMASYKAVSHCYQRPTYPSWQYPLFTMIHERTVDRCEAVVRDISKETGITEYDRLVSDREFKKVRVRYFNGDIERWERENLIA